MVNDKMVNGFMTKRQYIFPLVEVHLISTSLMITGPASVLPGPGTQGAPARRPGSNTEVF